MPTNANDFDDRLAFGAFCGKLNDYIRSPKINWYPSPHNTHTLVQIEENIFRNEQLLHIFTFIFFFIFLYLYS